MSCVAPDHAAAKEPEPCCIIGFGNVHRQDDGIGPWIVDQLRPRLAGRRSIRLMSGHHMDPSLVDDLRDAGRIVIIDASVQQMNGGWHWETVDPRADLPTSLHSFEPGLMLHLLERVYGNRPDAWLISIQGESFGYGEGLSPSAQKRAGEVISALDAFLSKEGNYGDRA